MGLLGKDRQKSGSDIQPRTEPNTPENLTPSRKSTVSREDAEWAHDAETLPLTLSHFSLI